MPQGLRSDRRRSLPLGLPLALPFALALACKAGGPAADEGGAAQQGAPAATASDADAAAAVTDAPPLRRDGTLYAESELMGTRVSINVYVGDPQRAEAAATAIRDAFAEIARIESIASEWQADSDLSRLNAAAGGSPVEVPAELFEILERARTISEDSEGRFDVTFHAVGALWSFRPGSRPPSAEAVREKLPLVNWAAVELDAETGRVRLPMAGMKVGLGAIAKGYAVDRASALLIAAGFENHVVEGGGDTYAAGLKNGAPWRIGVQDPERAGALGSLTVSDRAVVTSGDYMRGFEWEGRRYSHILDPKTGFPIPEAQSLRSVTCVAADATDADAYCTALAVLGAQHAMAFVEARPKLDAILIDADGVLSISSGLQDNWTPMHPSEAQSKARREAPSEAGASRDGAEAQADGQ